MKTLNTIFVDRRLAPSLPAGNGNGENSSNARAEEWLARLRYLRSRCVVPGVDPFGCDHVLGQWWHSNK